MNQNLHPTNCPFCLQKMQNHYLYHNSLIRLYCYDCDINFDYTDNSQFLFQIKIYNDRKLKKQYDCMGVSYSKYCIEFNYFKDKTYFSYYIDEYNIRKKLHELPKAFPLDYVFSNSKDEILAKINKLLNFK